VKRQQCPVRSRAYASSVIHGEVKMSTLKNCLDCGKCPQAAQRKPAFDIKSLLCLFSRSPFALRLMLLEKLAGKKCERPCEQIIWRG